MSHAKTASNHALAALQEFSITVQGAWRIAVVSRRHRQHEVLLWSLGGQGRLRGLARTWRCQGLTQAHALQMELASALEGMPSDWSTTEVLRALPRRPQALGA